MNLDGPGSALFMPVALSAGSSPRKPGSAASAPLDAALADAPRGDRVFRGIPFHVGEPLIVGEETARMDIPALRTRWLVFLHCADQLPLEANADGLFSPMRGEGGLGERACTYRVVFGDGSESALPIRRRFQIGCFARRWGENCFEAVSQAKPRTVRPPHEQLRRDWGSSQTRVRAGDEEGLLLWLWAWENPTPDVPIISLHVEPGTCRVAFFGVSAGSVSSHPLRWETRRKALLSLPPGESFSFDLDDVGLLEGVRLDLGQVISAQPRPLYPDAAWETSHDNQVPPLSSTEVLIEYTAHPEAVFHLPGGRRVAAAELAADATAPGAAGAGSAAGTRASGPLAAVAASTRRVRLRVVEKAGGAPVAVKLHVHGAADEYLAPVDRNRIPNPAWYEDYSVDFVHQGAHRCTYIAGETTIDVPLGPLYVEVAKGFEVRPVRRRLVVDSSTDEICIELERVLPWRTRGWVTADTHVHFLSPGSALLEGNAEGVNVVNLLASQWGELMTNIGDFDGRTTWGSREAGGDGEYLVRVGTENRQHVLGHISLLGYKGRVIAPMTVAGPDESALGDALSILLSEWADACHGQGGLVIVPHFPNPRAEHAAAIVAGKVDGIEMTSWGDLYGGISAYSLSDWYRYLNCGYMAAAVGGTDKMSADTAVGTVRTYARIPDGRPFTYEEWMQAVRRAETFVTYGPLMEMSVEGKPMGSRIRVSGAGGTFAVAWEAASVTVPMTRVDLVVNGEIRESMPVDPGSARGSWSVKVERSSWIALLVRGCHPGRPEMIAAHSSPVMIEVGATPFFAAADALTILEQIEGAMAYVDILGTRAETAAWKRMRLVLESAHRSVHNRLHAAGFYHEHTSAQDHPEHHRT
jgi:hypothetical protein